MLFSTWLAFIAVAMMACFTPGPAVLLAITNAMNQGGRHTLLSSTGNVVGLMCVCIVTMIGLGAALKTSATLFLIVKVLGAAYLIYLGVKQWLSRGRPMMIEGDKVVMVKSSRRLFQEGVTVALTNPKSILFCTALFPQFLTHQDTFLQEFAVLTATFMACSFFSHIIYIFLACRLKHLFISQRATNWFNRLAGTVFIVLGVGLLRVRPA